MSISDMLLSRDEIAPANSRRLDRWRPRVTSDAGNCATHFRVKYSRASCSDRFGSDTRDPIDFVISPGYRRTRRSPAATIQQRRASHRQRPYRRYERSHLAGIKDARRIIDARRRLALVPGSIISGARWRAFDDITREVRASSRPRNLLKWAPAWVASRATILWPIFVIKSRLLSAPSSAPLARPSSPPLPRSSA